jgi:hypothetical protein
MNTKEFKKFVTSRPKQVKAWYNRTEPDAMKILVKKMGIKELEYELERGTTT